VIGCGVGAAIHLLEFGGTIQRQWPW